MRSFEQFREAIQSAGLVPHDLIEPDGKPPLLEIVARYIDLKKVGSNFRGLCPFMRKNSVV